MYLGQRYSSGPHQYLCSSYQTNGQLYSLKVTDVLNVELASQVYVPPSVARKGENWRMVTEEPLITNTLDEVSVLVMVSEPFIQSAGAVLQERVSDWPTVVWWLPPLTSAPPMVTTGPTGIHLRAGRCQREGCLTLILRLYIYNYVATCVAIGVCAW